MSQYQYLIKNSENNFHAQKVPQPKYHLIWTPRSQKINLKVVVPRSPFEINTFNSLSYLEKESSRTKSKKFKPLLWCHKSEMLQSFDSFRDFKCPEYAMSCSSVSWISKCIPSVSQSMRENRVCSSLTNFKTIYPCNHK